MYDPDSPRVWHIIANGKLIDTIPRPPYDMDYNENVALRQKYAEVLKTTSSDVRMIRQKKDVKQELYNV